MKLAYRRAKGGVVTVLCRRLRSGIALATLGSLLFSLSGCAFQRQRINIEHPFTRLSRVKVGETRVEELPPIFGTAPSSVVPMPPDRQGHVYSYGDSKTWMLGLVIFNVQKTNTGLDTAVIVVDRQGVVQDKIYGTNSKDLSWEFWPFGGE